MKKDRRKLTNGEKNRIIQLYRAGWSIKRIADDINTTYHHILYYVRSVRQLDANTMITLIQRYESNELQDIMEAV